MSAPARDPRVDPRKGDVLRIGGHTRTVTERSHRIVRYELADGGSGGDYETSLGRWRIYNADAEVVTVAEVQP